MATEHLPVLAPELIALTDPGPGELVVDCTFGGGGHARLAAERIGPTGKLIAIDRDPAAAERFADLEPELPARRASSRGDYADVLERLAADGRAPDVVIMDLGISSLQLDAAERGFSYSYDAPLDMRMDPAQPLSALEVVNEWPAKRLEATIRELGEERHARSIAAEISRRRPLATTGELVEAIAPRSRRPIGSAAATPRSAPSRRSGSPSTPSSSRSSGAWWAPGDCSRGRPAGRDRLPLARGPAGQALVRGPRPGLRLPARAARSAGAATSPRRSCSRAAPSSPPRRRSSAIHARARPGCGWRASSPTQESPRRGRKGAEVDAMAPTATARAPRRHARAAPRDPDGARAAPARRPQPAPRLDPDHRLRPGRRRPHGRRGRRDRRLGDLRLAHPGPALDRPARGAAGRDRGPKRDGAELQRLVEQRRPAGRRPAARRTRPCGPSSRASSRASRCRPRRRQLGLVFAPPGSIRYLHTSSDDAPRPPSGCAPASSTRRLRAAAGHRGDRRRRRSPRSRPTDGDGAPADGRRRRRSATARRPATATAPTDTAVAPTDAVARPRTRPPGRRRGRRRAVNLIDRRARTPVRGVRRPPRTGHRPRRLGPGRQRRRR